MVDDIKSAVAIDVASVASIKAQNDAKELKEQRAKFLKKCRTSKKKKVFLSAMDAQVFGSPYTYTLNGVPVTLVFDDKEHEFPEFIANSIQEKLVKVHKNAIPKAEYKQLF